MIPVIETLRLRLRGHTLADYPAGCAMWADPLVTRFIGGKPSNAQEVWARLLRYVGHWSLLGFGYWVIEEKSCGAFVGEVGFADFKRDLTPPFDAPEMGWALMPAAHGKGYATEAINATVAWAEARWPRIVCMISPENAASIHVATKFGFREYARTAYAGSPTILFERHHA